MLNFTEDFKNYTPTGGDNLEGIFHNRENLKALGIDPDGADTAFDAKYVYCGAHMRSHATGWCTVRLALKRPLEAQTGEEARAEVSSLGYPTAQ